MVVDRHRLIAEDALNFVVLSSFTSPTHGHTLLTYTLLDNRTISTVDRTGTTKELAAIKLRQP